MKKETHTCWLRSPATCTHRLDGKFAYVVLCGGNSLSEDVADCPYRYPATIQDSYVPEDTDHE